MNFIEGFEKTSTAESELKRMWSGTVHDKSKEKPPLKNTVRTGAVVGGLLGTVAGQASGMKKGRFLRHMAKGALIGAPAGAAAWTALHDYWWRKAQAKKRKK